MRKENKIPQNIEAEKIVLTALIFQHGESQKIIELLKKEYFHDKRNSYLFEVISRMLDAGMVVDHVMLHEQAKTDNKEDEISFDYLMEVDKEVPNKPFYHARLLYEKWVLRKLIETSQKIIDRAYEGSEDVFDLASASAEEINNVLNGIIPLEEQNLYDRLPKIFEDIKNRMTSEDGNSLQSSYFPTLNKWTGGIRAGDFIQISGKDKHGKTTVAYTLALDFAINQKIPVGVFSLEMENEVLSWKAISLECDIAYQKLRNPKGLKSSTENLTVDELDKVGLKAQRRFYKTKIYVCDKVLNERQIKAKMKKMIKEYGVKFFMVDYIGLIPTTGKFETREREIAYLSRFFKLACKELSVSICVLSQQNREGKIAESKGLDRDCDFAFSIRKAIEEGITKLKIEGTEIDIGENDFVLTVDRSRHGYQGRSTIVSYLGNKFREGTYEYKVYEEPEDIQEEFLI